MISWQSVMSVFNTKGTLLKWLKTLDQSLKDGVLESVSVNSVSEGIITLSFNFADGSVITTPQIDIPQGAQGPQGPQGEPGEQGPQGVPGPAGADIFTDFDSLKIDTTDATVTYINGVATITGARLIGYKSGSNEEIEIAVDLPIKAGDNVTIDASEDDKSILISTQSPDIPTPTTADNGKVLGVTNGAYALQESSGGGGSTGYTVTKSGVLVNSETFICEHADGTITELSRQSSASAQNVVKVYITAGSPPGPYHTTANAKKLVNYFSGTQELFIYSIAGNCTFSSSTGGGGADG